MANKTDESKTLRCSFCGKTQDQVRKLIAGPNGLLFATSALIFALK